MSHCCSAEGSCDAPAMAACPVNGAPSKQVDMLTVKSLVRRLPLGMLNTQYYFCDAQDCDVVYFALDPQAPVFCRADLIVRVGVKETADPIPVCYCFDFTRGDIQVEISNMGRSTIAERISVEIKAGNCACEVKNPSGKCCLGSVTRETQNCLRNPQVAATNVAV